MQFQQQQHNKKINILGCYYEKRPVNTDSLEKLHNQAQKLLKKKDQMMTINYNKYKIKT